MSLSAISTRVLPTGVGFVTGGPVGAFTAAVSTEQAKKQEKQVKRQINEYNARIQQAQERDMAFGDPNVPGAFPTSRPASIGQTNFIDRLGGVASKVGRTLLTG